MSNTLIVQWLRVLTSVLALLLISQSVAGQNEIRDQSRHTISAELSTEAAKRASVTIVEYSDFQCPYCKRAATIVSQVKQAYGDSVKIVFKQMPLPFHQHAFKAAQASVCSAQQGKFWEFHDRVFASADLSVDSLRQIASEAGLKAGEFNACVESEASRAVVEQEVEEARRLGVTGTPTFIINGRKVVGAVSFDAFKREIDREIMRAQNPTPPDRPAKSINPAIEILNGDNALVDARNAGVQRAVREVVTAANQPRQATTTVTSTGVNLSPGSVAFGHQLVGTTSNQIVETVTNSTNTPLIITDISVSGRDRRDFTTSYNFGLPVTVAPGNNIAIDLTFTPLLPWRAGTRNARLEIAEKNDSQNVTLTGIGATCGGPLPACSSGCADADGDGLNDAWEMAGGIDLNNDGVVDATHDLLLPAADPNKPDIFVQYDWMDYGLSDIPCATDSECTSQPGLGHAGETCTGPATPYSTRSCVHACVVDSDCTGLEKSHVGDLCVQNSCEHTHDPEVLSPGALQAVIDAFAAHGFNLHILRGRALPHSHVVSFRKPEANCEGANVSPGTLGAYAVNLYDLKNVGFDPRRTAAFHYSVFGHLSSCDNDGHCDTPTTTGTCPAVKGSRPQLGQTGQAEISGNDFTVSLGHFVSDLGGAPRRTILAGTFMHELGHNFGLHHGGGTSLPGTLCVAPDCEDGPQFKPNYLSVMNYRYQTTGILEGDAVGSSAFRSCSADADCSTSSGARCEHFGFGGICLRLDYSSSVLPTGGNTPGALTENGQLNEPAGLGSGTSDLFSFDDGQCSFVPFAATHGPVNWDGVGLPDNPNARSDLNTQDHSLAACTVTNQTLRGHTDWGPALGQSIFTMAFQCTSNGLADGASLAEGLADKRVVDSGQISQGELSPEMSAAAHVLYPPRPVRLQIDLEASLTQQSKSRHSTRTVTLLGTEDLDVAEIDQTSLRVGGLVPLGVSVRDVDGDGRGDLIVEFDATQLPSRAKAEKIRVSGWLKNSQVFVGDAELNSKRVSSSETSPPGTVVRPPSRDGDSGMTQTKKVVGAISFEAFKQEVDQAMLRGDTGIEPIETKGISAFRATLEAAAQSPRGAIISAVKQPRQEAKTVTSAGVTLSSGSVTFGYQLVGATGPQIVETVTNSGTAALVITDISVSGRDRRDFMPTYSFTLPVTVASGNSIAINLTFTPLLPWRAGIRNARLEIAEKKDSLYVTLTGIGATCGGPLPACSSGCPDADGDGLNEAWEIAGGIDVNNDGVVDATHDLVLHGADPNKPDIFVQYDWMDYGLNDVPCQTDSECTSRPGLGHAGETCTGPATPYSAKSCVHACVADADCTALGMGHIGDRCVQNTCEHTHDPEVLSPGALQAVVDAFAAHGFNLHIVRGRAVPHSHVVSFRAPEANCEGADVPPGTIGAYAVNLDDLKKLSFEQAKLRSFHYSVFGHLSSCDNDVHCDTSLTAGTCPAIKGGRPQLGQSGQAELPGNDFIVSLGHFVNDLGGKPGATFITAGTFMHELGHNLGLHHGGGTSPPGSPCVAPDCEDLPVFKPNYLSVMNYLYQSSGILEGDAVGSSSFRSCSTDADCSAGGARCDRFDFGGICLRLDFSNQVLPTGGNTPGALNENGQLNELAGLGSGTSDLFTFSDGQCSFVQFAATEGPVNWDGVGLPDNPNATSDLNPLDHASLACTVTTQVHRGHTDWGPAPGQSIFTMAFQCTPNGIADGASLSERVAGNERVADSGQIAQGELTPEMAAAAHVLYPPRPIRLQIDPEPRLTQRSKSRPSTRTVTLLGTEDLDVTEIDQTSLRVGSLVPLSVLVRDVDGDGRPDLIVEFDAKQLTSRAKAEKIRVTGWLKNSQVFIGDAELTRRQAARAKSKRRRVGGIPPSRLIALNPLAMWAGVQA